MTPMLLGERGPELVMAGSTARPPAPVSVPVVMPAGGGIDPAVLSRTITDAIREGIANNMTPFIAQANFYPKDITPVSVLRSVVDQHVDLNRPL